MRSLGLLVIVHALLTSPLYSADDFRVRSAFVHKSGLTLLEVEGLQVFNDEEVKDTNWSLTHGKGGIYWSADGETYHRLKAVDDRPNIVYLRDGGRGRVVYIANSNISGHVGATVEVLYKERKGVEVPSGARFTCETTVCFKPLPNLKEIESKILHKDITLASHTDARSLEYLFEINKGTKKAYLAIDREFFDADKRTFEAWLVHPGINRQDAIDITSVEAGRVRSVMSDTYDQVRFNVVHHGEKSQITIKDFPGTGKSVATWALEDENVKLNILDKERVTPEFLSEIGLPKLRYQPIEAPTPCSFVLGRIKRAD